HVRVQDDVGGQRPPAGRPAVDELLLGFARVHQRRGVPEVDDASARLREFRAAAGQIRARGAGHSARRGDPETGGSPGGDAGTRAERAPGRGLLRRHRDFRRRSGHRSRDVRGSASLRDRRRARVRQRRAGARRRRARGRDTGSRGPGARMERRALKAGSVRRCAIVGVSSFGAIAILLSALAPTVAAETGAADEPPRAAALDAIFAEYSEGRSPGVSVGVLWNGRTFARGYGYADLEQDVPITPDTVFHVASVSKQFTAFSAALVAADGALDLDADIRSVLPEVPDFRAADAAMGPITPRQLVYHTSGLRDQWTLFALGGMGLDNRLRQQQILRMVARQEALNFPPGTDYTYSNTGYTLLAELVQRTSGKSFAEFAEARIFQPLGMTSTLFYDDVTELVPRRAHSYEREGKGGWRRSLLNFDTAGATSLHTTAPDLLKWAQNILEPSVGAGFAMGELM